MNRFGAVVLAVMASVPGLAGTWSKEQIPGGQGGNVLSLVAPSEARVFGTGTLKDQQGNDKMYWVRAPDGKSWKIEEIKTPSPGEMLLLTDLVCVSDQKCFTVGMGVNQQTMGFFNRFGVSADGGDTWLWPKPLPLPESRIVVLDEANLWFVAGNTNCLKTTDGGVTFKPFAARVGQTLFTAIQDGSFLDTLRGWLVNGDADKDEKTGAVTIHPKGAVLETTDGGKTFVALLQDKPEVYERVKFVSDKVGFLTGYNDAGPFLRRTDDGGATWTDMALPPVEGGAATAIVNWHVFNDKAALILAVRKVNDQTSFFSIWRMKDGKTLADEPIPSHDGYMIGLACAGQKRCWAGGKNMEVLAYEGTDDDVVASAEPVGGPDVAFAEPLADAVIQVEDGTAAGDGVAADTAKTGGSGAGGCNAGPSGSFVAFGLVLLALWRPFSRGVPCD